MNLSTIATAKFSEIKTFAQSNNLIPSGDLRLKQVWLDAVTAFLTPIAQAASEVIATATSPEAVATYKASAVITFKFVYRAFVISCLLAIALGMSAADTWHQFRTWLEAQNLTLNQPVAVVRLIASKTRKRLTTIGLQRWDRLQDWLEAQTFRAWGEIAFNAIQPATEFRQRINAARFVITH